MSDTLSLLVDHANLKFSEENWNDHLANGSDLAYARTKKFLTASFNNDFSIKVQGVAGAVKSIDHKDEFDAFIADAEERRAKAGRS